MVTVKGTVTRVDMAGGTWVLAADDGRRYQLESEDPRLYKNGLRATVSGEIATDTFTIGMMGDTLRVKSFTPE